MVASRGNGGYSHWHGNDEHWQKAPQANYSHKVLIRKNLMQLIFSGASIWRWNDKLRPLELTEIDKQAHKMLVACALWHETAKNMQDVERIALAMQICEGALFDYFYRLIITDIKPPVFYKIRQNRDHFQKLTQYVLEKLESTLAPTGNFWQRLKNWHGQESKESGLARMILTAAHLFASRWEFQLIQPQNPFDEEMPGIARSFEDELALYANLPGMAAVMAKRNALGKFANLCGQLRFQIRWTQIPRIPATSVLGHMFIVAVLGYMFSLSVNASPARACNNFFSGLFHDFPEVLTRDIISPVKQSIPGLGDIIRKYEQEELNRRVLTPLRQEGFNSFAEQIYYYLGYETGSEFQDCYRKNGAIIVAENFTELCKHDHNDADPKDGQLLKTCDLLAAFLEAHNSIHNGVASPNLLDARFRLKQNILQKAPQQLHLDALLADFD